MAAKSFVWKLLSELQDANHKQILNTSAQKRHFSSYQANIGNNDPKPKSNYRTTFADVEPFYFIYIVVNYKNTNCNTNLQAHTHIFIKTNSNKQHIQTHIYSNRNGIFMTCARQHYKTSWQLQQTKDIVNIIITIPEKKEWIKHKRDNLKMKNKW